MALTLGILASSCIPPGEFAREGSSNSNKRHGSSVDNDSHDEGGGDFFSSLFGSSPKSILNGESAQDAKGIVLSGAKGQWPSYVTDIAEKEIKSHPNLIHGIPGRGNPLAGICDNYMSLKPDQRINVLLKVAPSLAYGESHFGFNSHGGERRAYNRALGPFQISPDAKNFGCWTGGFKPKDWRSNLDCVYKIMDSQYTRRGLPVANNQSHWSVMRPNNKLSQRFMPTFKKLAPECDASYAARPNKNFPGAEIVGGPNMKGRENAI